MDDSHTSDPTSGDSREASTVPVADGGEENDSSDSQSQPRDPETGQFLPKHERGGGESDENGKAEVDTGETDDEEAETVSEADAESAGESDEERSDDERAGNRGRETAPEEGRSERPVRGDRTRGDNQKLVWGRGPTGSTKERPFHHGLSRW